MKLRALSSWQRLAPLAAVFLVVFASCYPNGPQSVEDYDAIVTAVDPDADFSKLLTFTLADTVVSITNPDQGGKEHDRSYDPDILEQVRTNMVARGFQEMPNADENNPPDIVVLVGVATWKNYDAYSSYPIYGGWGWWGGYGYYAPWYGSTVVYSYRVGTLMVFMIDGKNLDVANEIVRLLWAGAANGLIDGGRTKSDVLAAIDQMFTQSPYLEAGQ